MKPLITIFLTLALSFTAQADLIVELSIENQEVQGADFFFDIYLTRHPDSHGDIYLADLDLVLNFNAQYFTDPVLSAVENDVDATGFCAFSPIIDSPQAETDCRAEYFAKTAVTEISGNELTINLLGPEPPDATSFDGLIAWVDGEPSKHRLGRFKISGINDQMGTAGLVWAETQEGTMTKVYSFQNFAPWDGKSVEILTNMPPDVGLDSVVSSTVEIVKKGFSVENIYPNPVADVLNLEVNSQVNSEVMIRIIDGLGRVSFEQEIVFRSGENRFSLDLSQLASGHYYLNLSKEEFSETSSFEKY